MSRNAHVPAERLEVDIRAGTIDTVIVGFSDRHGRSRAQNRSDELR